MSKKNKLERFAENKTFPNLFEYSYERIMSEGFPLQGKWHADFFHNLTHHGATRSGVRLMARHGRRRVI